MPELLAVITEFLGGDEWPYEVEDDTLVRTGFQGDHGRWEVYIGIRSQQGLVTVLSIYPLNAPPARREAIGEYLHRASYGIFMGNFELDYDSGRIQCKTGIDVTDAGLTPVMVQHLVYTSVTLMDKYYPGLTAVLHDELSPADAIHRIEG